MKKNTRNYTLTIVATFVITLFLSSFIGFKTEGKVFMSDQEYEYLKSLEKKYEKAEVLEEIIDSIYLREIDEGKIVDGLLKGLVNSLEDPYSAYLNEEEYKSLNEKLSGEFGGVGIVVSPGQDDFITVVSPIAGTPADRAGIISGDKIIKVNGEEFSASQMDQAVKIMRGEPGSEVELTILREIRGKREFLEIKLTREIIKVETVESRVLEDKIGYLKISSFDDPTYDDFKIHIDKLGKAGIEKLVLDLRGNPGGRLDIVVKIADEFLDKGIVVYTEDKEGKQEFLNSKDGKLDYPMIVLIDRGSASASEIFAGAMRDRSRAKLLGETSFGKGLVQQIIDLGDGTGLKLTISEYFTPKGIAINGEGVKPDIEVELDEGVRSIGPDNIKEDNQLRKAIEILKGK